MKRIFVVMLVFLVFSCLIIAGDQRKIVFNVGYAGFKDINSGPTFGINFGKQIDNRVAIGLETNIFRKSMYDESAIADTSYASGIYQSTLETAKESHRTIVPLVGTIDIDIGHFQNRPLKYKLGGGFGYQLLFGSSVNYQGQGITDNKAYAGWLWFLKTGLEYQISRTTSFIWEVIYSSSRVSRASDIEADLPTEDVVNLSGLGARFGLSLALDWH
ncbi:hypothetical protein KKG58_01745 [Patescibacteria group bacterium]|nr:hypothetical protein [Patescibacteria group bacterium]